MNSLCEHCKTNEISNNEESLRSVLCAQCQDKFRSRSQTRSMSMVVDSPLPDINSLYSAIERMPLDSLGIRLKDEMKKIMKFQKKATKEIEQKSDRMIKQLI